MASFVRNIGTKNYNNFITVLQVMKKIVF